MCRKFIILGVTDSRRQYFPLEVRNKILGASVFSGGTRHRDIMNEYLPEDYEWIDVKVPLEDVFRRYEGYEEIFVMASGDPLFYGYAATLKRRFPDAELEIIPAFNSLQMLAHRLALPYQEMVNVSLTGRDWKGFDDALIRGYRLIGCLTDRKKGPAEIARRMLYYGYDNYRMAVGVSLGNEEDEEILEVSLEEAGEMKFPNPNCIILRQTRSKHVFFGIPEGEFRHLEGRVNMITKMGVRLLSLSMLDLPQRKSLWDIGFCTGSVSIEARLRFPHLAITSFEVREESREIMEANCRKFGTPSITSVIGDFMAIDIDGYERPDAVFIGGHGGHLPEMLAKIARIKFPGCVIVFNSVSDDSCRIFRESVETLGMRILEEHKMTLDHFNPITIMKAQ